MDDYECSNVWYSVSLIHISCYTTTVKNWLKGKNQLSWVYLERTIQHLLLDEISCDKVQPWRLSVSTKPPRCYRQALELSKMLRTLKPSMLFQCLHAWLWANIFQKREWKWFHGQPKRKRYMKRYMMRILLKWQILVQS